MRLIGEDLTQLIEFALGGFQLLAPGFESQLAPGHVPLARALAAFATARLAEGFHVRLGCLNLRPHFDYASLGLAEGLSPADLLGNRFAVLLLAARLGARTLLEILDLTLDAVMVFDQIGYATLLLLNALAADLAALTQFPQFAQLGLGLFELLGQLLLALAGTHQTRIGRGFGAGLLALADLPGGRVDDKSPAA